jgi:hypothetical protein
LERSHEIARRTSGCSGASAAEASAIGQHFDAGALNLLFDVKGVDDIVNYPHCGTANDRREFEPDETYFECMECEVALVLTPAEQVAEVRRTAGNAELDQTLYGTASPQLARAADHDGPRSLAPLRLWIGLLIVGAVIRTFVGVDAVVQGSYVEGLFSLAYSVGIVVPTVIGLIKRMRFALYTTYLIFGVNSLNVLLHTVQSVGLPPERFGGRVIGALVSGGITVLWLRWFVKNRRVFGSGMETAGLVDDIYSPGAKRDV